MKTSHPVKVGLDSMLTPDDCVLMLIDHQPFQVSGVKNRTQTNTWEDERCVEWVEKTGRKKVVMAALWTEICLAFPVLHALGDGYEVYFLSDASGGTSVEAHELGIQRMIQAGAVPLTTVVFGAELQRGGPTPWPSTPRSSSSTAVRWPPTSPGSCSSSRGPRRAPVSEP